MANGEKTFTPLAEHGKARLIERYASLFSDLVQDPACKGETVSVQKLFTEGIHFNLVYFPLKHLGYKVITSTLAVLLGNNALPSKFILNLGVSSKLYLEHLDDFFDGVVTACKRYGIPLHALDINPSVNGFIIACTLEGRCTTTPVNDNGAKPNDVICVTGNFGAAYMGLQILERERKIFESEGKVKSILERYPYLIERQLKPEARKETLMRMKELAIQPTAMTSVNDSLAYSLLQICHHSQTGCKIFAEKIPVDQETAAAAEEMYLEPLTCALNGGDDNELLFTIPVYSTDKMVHFPEVKMIGHMTGDPAEKLLIFESGSIIPLRAQGWKE